MIIRSSLTIALLTQGVNVTQETALKPLELWHRRLPSLITVSRMVMSFMLVPFLLVDADWAKWTAGILFIVASITDWLDGYLARTWKCETAFGKLMDPIADKILVLVVLVVLLSTQKVDPFVVMLLLSRDIFIGGIRSVAASENRIIAANPSGKWKTGLQMAAIPCLIIDEKMLGLELSQIGYIVLWVSVGLSIFSGFQYTWQFFKATRSIE